MNSDTDIRIWLEAFMAAQGASSGTVHLREGDVLHHCASVNIPDKVIELTRVIPKGKGMAGLAWERDQPVTTCNLKDDNSGDVRPGAKAVDAQAAAAMPVHDASGALRAVVGLAWHGDHDVSEAALAEYQAGAEQLPS